MRHVPDAAEQARYRNYIIDALELAGSLDDQLAYQASVPIAQGSAEVLLHWSDVYHPEAPDYYTAPAFSPAELDAIKAFHIVWERVCEMTPDRLPALEKMVVLPEWTILRNSATEALQVFAVRGRLAP